MKNNKKMKTCIWAGIMIVGMAALSGCTGSKSGGQDTEKGQKIEKIRDEVMADEEETDKEENIAIKSEDKKTNEEVSKELEGNIISLEEGSFTISEIVTQKNPDGNGDVAVGVAAGAEVPEEDLITVKYTDQTVFTMRISTDGVTATDSAGIAKDLEESDHVIMTGKRDGQIYKAESIVIFRFISN